MQHCRAWKQTIIEDIESLLESPDFQQASPLPSSVFNHIECDSYPSPEDEYTERVTEVEADEFIDDVRSGLDKEAQWVLNQLLSEDIPDQVKLVFKRNPSRVSASVIGMIFGWDRSYSRRVIDRVKKRVRLVIQSYRLSDSTVLWSEA
jgi:hypothetical protein